MIADTGACCVHYASEGGGRQERVKVGMDGDRKRHDLG